ncbi:MAG: response regulator, partial [Candidatus Zixiibacteriota bacterium]
MSEKTLIDDRGVRILVVDDEEIVLSLARDALEDSGYQIELAGSSSEAIQKLEHGFFDFLLTDIRMPECDGIQLAKMARDIIPSIGIIFMTGYANLGTAKDAIKEGAYDYILKPFELKEIRQAVKNAVSKKQKNAEKTISNELSRLSELNELMYTVGDRKSLVRLSLGFALMQGKARKGAIAFKKDDSNEIGIISAEGLDPDNFQESFHDFDRDYFSTSPSELSASVIISTLEEHPLYKLHGSAEMAAFLIPKWYAPGDQLVNVALKRGSKLYGILILGYGEDSDTLKDSDLKFLTITANQIAISLENISLLEDSRNAYSRLKDLQNQTIQLEKMATKGEMSAEIGHELNNFLGVVSGNISLLEHHLEKKEYDEFERYLKAVQTNLDQIKKFTADLMGFS